MKSYFFIAVSTKENLELCKEYATAGFPDTINGAWTFSEISIGDFVTFLYGARAHNLYCVEKKEAIVNPENFPPWKSLYFKTTRKTVWFPFRIYLKPVREFNEPIAREQFAYIAENLLQRGGYWKTHFQVDQTTLQNVSQMGNTFNGSIEKLSMPPYETFEPKFIRKRKTPLQGIYQFREIILQSLVRRHLSKQDFLKKFLEQLNHQELANIEFEVLGEKALAEGLVDVLIKEARPTGTVKQIIIELKLGKANKLDLFQLKNYMKQIGEECVAGVLVAEQFPKGGYKENEQDVHLLHYDFGELDLKEPQTFNELLSAINLPH